MSRLDELIKELCPDGVEYKSFIDVADYIRGITYGKSDEINDNRNGYKLLRANNITLSNNVLNFDDIKTIDYNVKIKESQFLKKNDILICAGSGSKEHIGKVAFICQDMDYTFGGFMGVIRTKEYVVLPRYMFHILTSNMFKIYLKKISDSNSSTINNINNSTWKNFSIPVPPMPIQEEIVRILDKFTSLTAELKAELKARKKQYETYLNLLIENSPKQKRLPLNQIFEFRNGLSKGKDFFGKGSLFIKFKDVYNNRFLVKKNINALVECTPSELDKLSVKRGDVLFTRTSETIEDIGYSSVILENIENCVFNGFTIKATPKTDDLLPEYCIYCFSTKHFRQYLSQNCVFTTRASLTGKTIGEYIIGIPSKEEQEKIANILYKMHTLCNDLSAGLPAEIEKRQKQYEYFRDKLLTFKPKK